MGRIIPYIMENQKCSKPPTRIIVIMLPSGKLTVRPGKCYPFFVVSLIFQPLSGKVYVHLLEGNALVKGKGNIGNDRFTPKSKENPVEAPIFSKSGMTGGTINTSDETTQTVLWRNGPSFHLQWTNHPIPNIIAHILSSQCLTRQSFNLANLLNGSVAPDIFSL